VYILPKLPIEYPPGSPSRPNISVVGDSTPLAPLATTEEEDEALFAEDPWVCPPINMDYGTNLILGDNVFINFGASIIDTCNISIGARTLLACNVSLFSGTHPLDPEVRNGTKGPEMGKEIVIEADCWLGGNVTVWPGITIGRGSTDGAGSVVTKVCGTACWKCSRLTSYRMLRGTQWWLVTRRGRFETCRGGRRRRSRVVRWLSWRRMGQERRIERALCLREHPRI